MLTFTTLDGEVLDLGELSPDESAYWERCLAAYRADTPWAAFTDLAEGCGSPLVRAAGGMVTAEV